MFHQTHTKELASLQEQNRLLVYRCFNALNQQVELSGPQVISFLMGWGDAICSHRYTAVYWTQMAHALKQQYPSLGHKSSSAERSEQCYETEDRSQQKDDDNEVFTFHSDADGHLYMKSQVQDCALRLLRGDVFEDMNFLDFTVETYEVRKDNKKEDEEDHTSRVGRTRNARGCYLSNHPKAHSHIQIQRSEDHNYLPNVVGPWFPRRDRVDEDFYYAAILALLRPWRDLQELRREGETWKEEGLSFLQKATEKELDVVAGMQYYYDCKSKAHSRNQDGRDVEEDVEDVDVNEMNEEESAIEQQKISVLTEEDICQYEELQKYNREYVHGMIAVEAGRLTHMLPDDIDRWENKTDSNIKVASNDDLSNLTGWKEELERMMQKELKLDNDDQYHRDTAETAHDEGSVLAIDDLMTQMSEGMEVRERKEKEMEADRELLNAEQRRAFDIVDWHLRQTLGGQQPPQLRMVIPGEGGTGKSKTIQSIAANFDRLQAGHMLVKGGYTGIAASVIDGRTLHVLTAMPLKGVRSSKTMKRLVEFWKDKKYFIIDGQPLTPAERYAVITKEGQKKDGGEERAGLSKTVELTVGMPVMVTWNVHTELDVANGSRGEIVGIVLHPEEVGHEEGECVWKLSRPPLYILVRLLRTKIQQLPGLPPQVIPISPITKTFNISVGGCSSVVSRTQLPITPAYAFTDYRAQGQTIAPVIVDIARPPTGGITPFNVYVALSRAKGQNSIRLLRDFDERLLQQHPNEYLRVEDDRLRLLDEKTERWWRVIQKQRDST